MEGQIMKTIVCHGDSLTEGADLNPNYTWPDWKRWLTINRLTGLLLSIYSQKLTKSRLKIAFVEAGYSRLSGISPVAGSKRTCAPAKDGRNHARPCRKRKNPLALY